MEIISFKQGDEKWLLKTIIKMVQTVSLLGTHALG